MYGGWGLPVAWEELLQKPNCQNTMFSLYFLHENLMYHTRLMGEKFHIHTHTHTVTQSQIHLVCTVMVPASGGMMSSTASDICKNYHMACKHNITDLLLNNINFVWASFLPPRPSCMRVLDWILNNQSKWSTVSTLFRLCSSGLCTLYSNLLPPSSTLNGVVHLDSAQVFITDAIN
jgi:hypothetical protein